MALKTIFNRLKNGKKKELSYAQMLNGSLPVFSQFGNDVFASDIVEACIRTKATEISKLQPKHIFTDENGLQSIQKDSINRLLRFGPNELMTTKDFLEKCTWLHEKTYNCFIYPKYEIRWINGEKIKYYTGFYPLNPTEVDFLEDGNGKLYVQFHFLNSDSVLLPYDEVIHWRKEFSDNDLMGGNHEGKAKSETLLPILKINHSLIEGLDKAVKNSLAIRGLLKVNALLEEEKLEEERKEFEQKIFNSQSGILPVSNKSEYVPLTINPTIMDKETLEFIEGKVLKHCGTSLPILTGKFTEEDYQAYYEKVLEPEIIGLGQAFSKALFSIEQLEAGHEIIFYGQKLLFTNTQNKIAVADILGNRGALTDNQLLELFGYPPFPGGDTRNKSLNFIDRDIANQYQMSQFQKGKGVNQDE